MIDSHCHLDHAPLLENLKNVIGRAKSVGVNQFLTISTSIKSFENVKKLFHIIKKYLVQLVFTHMKQNYIKIFLKIH